MAFERWGSFSVRDHLAPNSLVANLLLFDRLVIPVPDSDAETKRWEELGWKPRLLEGYLEKLGDLGVQRPWDQSRQAQYESAMASVREISSDAKDMIEERRAELPYQMTRRILAQEKQIELPKGVTHVEVVSAHNSLAAFSEDFILEWSPGKDKSLMAVLFGQRLAVPQDSRPDVALSKTIELSRDADFKSKRRAFYDWQNQKLAQGYEPQAAVAEMEELIQEYNRCVERAAGQVYWKFAFTIGGIALGLAGASLGSPLAAASALLSLAAFTTLDRKQVVEPGDSRPAAMFHDAKRVVGWRTDQ